MERIGRISGHISAHHSHHGSNHAISTPTSAKRSVPGNAVVICCAVRTPITTSKRGLLKDCMPEELLKPLFEAIVDRTRIDPKLIEDVCIGNVLQPGAGAMSSKLAAILGGLPESTSVQTTNRFCSSGLQAVATIAAHISAGYIDIGIGGGVESMTQYDMMSMIDPEKVAQEVFDNDTANKCLLPMGMTSENVAMKFNITRQMQDEFAVESHAKASRAQKLGLYRDEIVPIKAKVKKGNEEYDEVVVDRDDGIREGTTTQTLSKLKPAFSKDKGTTTAGNSSKISDGAAMVLLARKSVADRLGLPILARFVSFAAVGVPPEIMGIGPAVAIPAALGKADLSVDDISIFEVNEAFASQSCYCASKLKIPKSKLNPKGGAIALGHPLGCTGARQIATLLPELRRTKGRFGVVSMCIGTGMGAAAVIENLQE